MTTPALVPNQAEVCPSCGRSSSFMPEFQSHHITPRSLGGTVTIRICVDCHQKTEGPRPIHMSYIPAPEDSQAIGWFYVMDLETGKTIAKRPAFQVMTDHGPLEPKPDWWDAPTFIAQLQNAPQDLRRLAGRFDLLQDDELVSAGEALGRLSHVAWELRARLFHLALSRAPWGRKDALLKDIARQFGLELRQARQEAAIAGWLEEHPVIVQKMHDLDEDMPPREAMKIIMAADDPEGATELWQTEYAGTRGTKTFAAVVATGQEPDYCGIHHCPDCGYEFPKHVRLRS